MRILALDLGTKTGYAISLQESGVLDLARKRFEGGGFIFVRFREKLKELLDSGITQVYFEEVRRHLGTDAAHLYGGLLAVLSEECELRKLPYSGIPVGTIKKHATGKGNANKDQMLQAAKNEGWNVYDDNHADALWLLNFVTK